MGRERFLVLADDLTGSLEAGAKFARQGIASLVTVDPGEQIPVISPNVSVLVIDTETRHASSHDAAHKVFELARKAAAAGFSLIYKKTDSTLRGNIGGELSGLLKAYPESDLLYVPSYPRMGRTVKDGVLYVYGHPVNTTEFGADALNPVDESSILKLLQSGIRRPIISITKPILKRTDEKAVYVCDADSEEEVHAFARFFVESSTFKLAAGPAAFLHYLAREMTLPQCPLIPLPQVRRALIVNGSRNRCSGEQLRYAEKKGFAVIDPALAPANNSNWCILRDKAQATEAPHEAACRIAHEVRRVLRKIDFDALVIFGGDTARAVLKALGSSIIHPIGEVLEGIPVSKISFRLSSPDSKEYERDLILITKAGGYGPVSVLPTIRELLATR